MEIERRAEQYPYIRPLKEVKHALQQFQNVMTTRAHRLYGKWFSDLVSVWHKKIWCRPRLSIIRSTDRKGDKSYARADTFLPLVRKASRLHSLEYKAKQTPRTLQLWEVTKHAYTHKSGQGHTDASSFWGYKPRLQCKAHSKKTLENWSWITRQRVIPVEFSGERNPKISFAARLHNFDSFSQSEGKLPDPSSEENRLRFPPDPFTKAPGPTTTVRSEARGRLRKRM